MVSKAIYGFENDIFCWLDCAMDITAAMVIYRSYKTQLSSG